MDEQAIKDYFNLDSSQEKPSFVRNIYDSDSNKDKLDKNRNGGKKMSEMGGNLIIRSEREDSNFVTASNLDDLTPPLILLFIHLDPKNESLLSACS
jgi:hypothetical protein